MPAVGDQHKPNGTAANPFDDAETTEKHQISAYTAQEIATLQARLQKQLGPEYISSRQGPGGGKVHYLAADKVINLANEVFGFNGWNSSIQNIQIDYVDENPENKKVSLGLSVIVRVTLKDGTYHEDVGYGSVENAKMTKAASFEKAKKEGTTDGLKRALRNFGNVLGNCIYDKEYLTRVTKVKVGVAKWDVNNLHRHHSVMDQHKGQEAVKPETKQAIAAMAAPENTSTAMSSDFDLADFDEAFNEAEFDHPDEVILPPDPRDAGRRTQQSTNSSNSNPRSHLTTPSRPPNTVLPQQAMRPPNAVNQLQPTPQKPASTLPPANASAFAQQAAINAARLQQEAKQISEEDLSHNTNSCLQGLSNQHFSAFDNGPVVNPNTSNTTTPNPTTGGMRTAGFYSARAAGKIDADNNPLGAVQKFNPHAESPSIRKTAGVDHKTSARLTKTLTVDTDVPVREEDRQDGMHAPMQRSGSVMAGQIPQAGPRPLGASVSNAPGFGMGVGQGVGQGSGTGVGVKQYRPLTRRAPDATSATTISTSDANNIVPCGADRVPAAAHQHHNQQLAPQYQRLPLQDVSNMQHPGQQHSVTAVTGDGADAKRQRVGGTGGAGETKAVSGAS